MWRKSTASCSPLSRIQQSNKKWEAGLPMRPSANVLTAWNALTHSLSREWAIRTLNAVAHASAAPSRSVSCGIHFQPANVRVYAYVWVCCVLVRSLNILFRLFQTSVCVRSCCLVDAQYLLLALRSCIVLGSRKFYVRADSSKTDRKLFSILSMFIKTIFV